PVRGCMSVAEISHFSYYLLCRRYNIYYHILYLTAQLEFGCFADFSTDIKYLKALYSKMGLS
ncbi:MAG: hypothetical protein AAGJ18_21405, partial [Bacteroidota bacterium]